MPVRSTRTRVRHAEALALREQGLTFQQIADRLGFASPQGARNAVRAAARRQAVTVPTRGASATGLRKFGLEVEFNGITATTAAAALNAAGINTAVEGYNHQTRGHWKIVTDGSVRATGTGAGSGLELVSPPLFYGEGYADVVTACEALVAAGATVDVTCGIHVHHDADHLPGEALAQVIEIYGRRQSAIDNLVAPSRRAGGRASNWCAHLSDAEIARQAEAFRTTGRPVAANRYRTVNTESFLRYGTLEFRQHGGSTNAEKIVAWIEFGRAIFAAAEAGAEQRLSTSLFEFIRDLNSDHGLSNEHAEFLLTRALRFTASQ